MITTRESRRLLDDHRHDLHFGEFCGTVVQKYCVTARGCLFRQAKIGNTVSGRSSHTMGHFKGTLFENAN
jgi:hypothetical protein